MNRLAAAAALCGSLIIGVGNMAFADQPGPDWMPIERVKTKMAQSGYSKVTELEANDGHWEGEGIKNGQKMEFHQP